ncbi:hypothetical protein HPP92_024772 [Vanilla planifolia]|uniref:Thaumatin-like protein n=1 Tax=Vanilla planifolia TaxID=51239 RepID=A0A835PLE1_VANPL|nr:hypothetical protein HPP92_024772 [Vanilla planifolia]
MRQLFRLLPCSVVPFFSPGGRRSYSARVFTIVNECKTTLWPGVTPGESFNGGGFPLRPGQSVVFTAPTSWSGRLGPRTGCNFDNAGNGSCDTGACGTSLKCGSRAKLRPLAEFTLASLDFYDVSLVDGFNVPVLVRPVGGSGNCHVAGCTGDLRDTARPSWRSGSAERLSRVGARVTCLTRMNTVVEGFMGIRAPAKPTYYSKKFKDTCPMAYSYAYDDPTSIFTCANADYVITFCAKSRQTVCSYHDNRLVCSGSTRPSRFIPKWLFVILVFVAGLFI